MEPTASLLPADQEERKVDLNEPIATAVIKFFKPNLGIQPIEGELDGDIEKGIGMLYPHTPCYHIYKLYPWS